MASVASGSPSSDGTDGTDGTIAPPTWTSSLGREDLWEIAVAEFSDDLKEDIDFYSSQKRDVISKVLDQVKLAEQGCREHAWKLKRKNGEVVVVRDVLAKVVGWIDRFKQIGDTIIQYDPVHAALPWAGVRFLLEIATNDFKTYDFVIEKTEAIAQLLYRCDRFEALLQFPSSFQQELRAALVRLYACIMDYLGRARGYFRQRTGARILRGILSITSSTLEASFDKINNAHQDVDNCIRDTGVISSLENNRELMRILDDIHNIRTPISRWSDKLMEITDGLDRERRTKILQWLSPEPHIKHHTLAKDDVLAGTGKWLLSDPTFIRWQEESVSSILWLHGIPGSGKSKLVSIVVEKALEAYKDRKHPPPAYFYCSRHTAEPTRADPDRILASIARQFSCRGPGGPILQPAVAEYNKKEEEAFASGSLRLEESRSLILELIKAYPVAIIIIDALDECNPKLRHRLLRAIESILKESSTLVKIFISSRDDQDIVFKLETYPNLEISSNRNSGDIAKFVEAKTNDLIENGDLLRHSPRQGELRVKIVKEITDGAHGMFRWASLQLDALCEHTTDAAILERIGHLPRTLGELYQEILTKLDTRDSQADRLYLRHALAWLLCARRKLMTGEFLAIVSVAVPGHQLTKEQLLQLCGNLVIFDGTLNTFRFAHLSVREFLEHHTDYSAVLNECVAAESCLRILIRIADNSVSETPLVEAEGLSELSRDGILGYVHTRWAVHYSAATSEKREPKLSRLLFDFTRNHTNPNSAFALWIKRLRMFLRTRPAGLRYDYHLDFETRAKLNEFCGERPSPILVACAFDIDELVEQEMAKSSSCGTTDSENQACLRIAADYGSYRAWNGLLTDSSIQMTQDIIERVAQSRKELMKFLLEKRGEEVQITSDVVEAAARNYRKEVMELLLEKRGEEIQITPEVVVAAARNSGEETMELLLEKRGEEVQITPEVVVAAAENRWDGKEVMELLLEKCGEAVQITPEVVVAAAENTVYGEEVMGLLLEKSRIPHSLLNQATSNGRTPLGRASWAGHVGMANLLFQNGVDIATADSEGWAPLHLASIRGHFYMVQVLLQHNADINALDPLHRTPIFLAAWNGHTRVVELLLASENIDIDVFDHYGSTALSVAARNGYEDVVKLLLGKGMVSFNAPDIFGRSPLWWVRWTGNDKLESLLLSHRGDIEDESMPQLGPYEPERDDEQASSEKEEEEQEGQVWCDVCMLDIPQRRDRYVCTGCLNGFGFDICSLCYESGAYCLGAYHMLQRVSGFFWYDM